MKVSWDDYSQYMEKSNSCSKQPTRMGGLWFSYYMFMVDGVIPTESPGCGFSQTAHVVHELALRLRDRGKASSVSSVVRLASLSWWFGSNNGDLVRDLMVI
jgi:hypothetical protein